MNGIKLNAKLKAYSKTPFYTDYVRGVNVLPDGTEQELDINTLYCRRNGQWVKIDDSLVDIGGIVEEIKQKNDELFTQLSLIDIRFDQSTDKLVYTDSDGQIHEMDIRTPVDNETIKYNDNDELELVCTEDNVTIKRELDSNGRYVYKVVAIEYDKQTTDSDGQVQTYKEQITGSQIVNKQVQVQQDLDNIESRLNTISNWTVPQPNLNDVSNTSLLGMEIKERKSTDKSLDAKISDEIQTRSKNEGDLTTLKIGDKSNFVNAINSEYDARVQEISRVDNRIDEETIKVNSSEEQTINSDLFVDGQITIQDGFVAGPSEVVGDLEIQSPQSTTSGGNLKVNGRATIGNGLNVNGDTTLQEGNLFVRGSIADNDVSISDGVITTKELKVNGNLEVLGQTITTINKTLEVDDNVIVTRANAETSPIDSSGLVISLKSEFDQNKNRISNKSVGIVYNPINDSVDLALGQLTSDKGDNQFVANESNPIVIRPSSADINNKNIVIWEKEDRTYNGVTYQSVRAIDSGKSLDDLATVDDVDSVQRDLDTLNGTVTGLTEDLSAYKEQILNLEADILINTNNISPVKDFYDQFLVASEQNPGSVLAVKWDNGKAVWSECISILDEGELG